MEIIKGKEIPPFRQYYDFDSLKHGDAFVFSSFKSATDTFRIWRKERNRPNCRLVRSDKPGEENLLFFVDNVAPGPGPGKRTAPKAAPRRIVPSPAPKPVSARRQPPDVTRMPRTPRNADEI